MKLSLVLATYGRAIELSHCLDSLLAQEDKDFEVIVVDQNTDGRLNKLLSEYSSLGLNIIHIFLPVPDLSAARNLGIRVSSGDLVGFPDDDCWYEPAVVAEVKKAFAVQTELMGVVANWVEQTVGGGNKHGKNHARFDLKVWLRFRGGAASSITLFFRKKLLIELGGFDVRFGIGKWYGSAEETDLVLRALRAGAIFQRTPDIKVHHRYGGDAFSVKKLPSAKDLIAIARRARGTGALYAKHRLSITTVLRGLIAPVLVPIVFFHGWKVFLVGGATSVGRVVGMIGWIVRDRS